MSTMNVDAILSTESPKRDSKGKLDILLPHVVLASACLILLAVNFWCYHRNNYERYQRKVEKIAHAMLSRTHRRVTSMMRYSDSKVFDVGTEYDLVRMEAGQANEPLIGNGADFGHETLSNAEAEKQVAPMKTDLCKREPLPMIMKTRSISLFSAPPSDVKGNPLQAIYNTS